MRRSASEKMELIRIVEDSDLSIRATLEHLGIARSTFYGWYERYLDGGFDALEDRKPRRRAGWNQIPKRVRENILALALDRTELSPRELACRYTDDERCAGSHGAQANPATASSLVQTARTGPAAALKPGLWACIASARKTSLRSSAGKPPGLSLRTRGNRKW